MNETLPHSTASRMIVTKRNFIIAALVSKSIVCGKTMLRSSPSKETPKSLCPVFDSSSAATCSSFPHDLHNFEGIFQVFPAMGWL